MLTSLRASILYDSIFIPFFTSLHSSVTINKTKNTEEGESNNNDNNDEDSSSPCQQKHKRRTATKRIRSTVNNEFATTSTGEEEEEEDQSIIEFHTAGEAKGETTYGTTITTCTVTKSLNPIQVLLRVLRLTTLLLRFPTLLLNPILPEKQKEKFVLLLKTIQHLLLGKKKKKFILLKSSNHILLLHVQQFRVLLQVTTNRVLLRSGGKSTVTFVEIYNSK